MLGSMRKQLRLTPAALCVETLADAQSRGIPLNFGDRKLLTLGTFIIIYNLYTSKKTTMYIYIYIDKQSLQHPILSVYVDVD